MLQLSTDENDRSQVAQRHVEPMVYLDHWGLRMFSEDSSLAGRLVVPAIVIDERVFLGFGGHRDEIEALLRE